MEEQKRQKMIIMSFIGIAGGAILAVIFLGIAGDMQDSYEYYWSSDYRNQVMILRLIGYLGAAFAVIDVIQLIALAAAGEQAPSGGNLVKCKDCGKMISQGAITCPNCGRPMTKAVNDYETPSDGWKCSCGRQNRAYVYTCVCGRSKSNERIVQEKELNPVEFTHCPKCGVRQDKTNTFCIRCGAEIK